MASHPVIIAPSILAADMSNIRGEIDSVVKAGADWLHIDVMDGKFVPPITFGDPMVAAVRKVSSLPLDVHLMIERPEEQVEAFQKAGATRLTIHQEACPHLHRVLGQIRAAGMAAGVAINPGTPVAHLFDVLELVDLVLVMTVNPGWGGQKFIHRSLERIEAVRREIDRQKLSIHIEVDGGISAETIKAAYTAGADAFVAGTYIFNAKDRAATIAALKEAVR